MTYKFRKEINGIDDDYKEILDANSDIVFMVSMVGQQLYFNKQVKTLLGYNIEDMIGKSFTDYVPKSEIPVYLKKLKEVFLKKQILPFETFALHKDGRHIPVEITGKIIKYKGGNVGVGTMRDITDRKKAEQALKKSEAELQESNRTKDKFFSIIAHDLKNPFSSLLGFSDLLLKNHKIYNEEKSEQVIKLINSSSKKIYNLLENLLTWSHSQSDKIKFSPQEINIKAIIDEVVLLTKPTAENKRIELLEDVKEDLFVYADKNMINVILRNLITNALKFTRKNGTVIVSAIKTKKQDFIEISVSDTGIGISKVRIKDLFRLDKNTSSPGTEDESGTGLGLILCKEFTEKNKGKIRVESKVNKGSKFTFTLPSTVSK
jgi:PAS domain S-box-containing protein